MTAGEPLIRWDWIGSHLDEIALRIGEHLELTVIAVVVGLVVAFALSFIGLRIPRLYPPITWVSGILYTIPSLALFSMLVPYTGLSLLTAEIGLVSYTLLILIRNIVGGIRSVPAEVRDAARGMGYTPRQILLRIELPLALGVIFAGIRVATITTIGLVTVTALIGEGGLGYFILLGIQLFFSTPLVIGALGSVALAVVADAALVLTQRALTPWTRIR
ncbi:MAG TPA: ABC transporter permease [Candidatus Polarisedimenticolia bacterium]|nr:ABC transporter permease [Candidatus Polarisedimenticolia bacterium]